MCWSAVLKIIRFFQAPYIFIKAFTCYSQTCIWRLLLGPLKSGRRGQVVVLENNFIKRPQPKSGRYGRFLVFISTANVLLTIKICWIKDLRFRVFWCHS